jgi:RimJ/RimL family protein N-acetyltransferase
MYQTRFDTTLDSGFAIPHGQTVVVERRTPDVVRSDWRNGLPTLTGRQVVLRELRMSDAASLQAMLSTEEVARFVSVPPSTVEGYERFIAWALGQRFEGASACFAVTLKGFDTAIGIFQVRQLDASFAIAEWGFAIGSPFWGTGVFVDAASLVLDFVFETVGAYRLEARAAAQNGRGNMALLKMGAVQEGLLRRALLREGKYFDQILYAIAADEWRQSKAVSLTVSPAQVH